MRKLLLILVIVPLLTVKTGINLKKSFLDEEIKVINDILPSVPDIAQIPMNYPKNCDTCTYLFYVYDTLVDINISERKIAWFKDTNNIPSYYPVSLVINSDSQRAKLEISEGIYSEKYYFKSLLNFTEIGSMKHDFEDYADFYVGNLLFSRVVFDEEQKYALCFCWALCGLDCGTYIVFLINKMDGLWQINKSITLGIF